MGRDYKIRGFPPQKAAVSFLDLLNHLVNFVLPALAMAVLVPSLARLVWWRLLKPVAWWLQVRLAAAVNLAVWVAGLALLGRDGAMYSYAALVVASALTVWWTGLRGKA
jgi:hypothetical protein